MKELEVTPVETASPDECQRCHRTMLIRDGEEATEICDHCAHDKVSELESQLTQVREERDKTLDDYHDQVLTLANTLGLRKTTRLS